MSRIGKMSITLPEKTTVSADGNGRVSVEGPKGKLEYVLPEGITLAQEDGVVTLGRASEDRKLRALHGTARSLVMNMAVGVSEGFVRELEIEGVGFRAAVKEKSVVEGELKKLADEKNIRLKVTPLAKNLDLALGRSHPIIHPIPESLTVTVEENTKIKVEGIDKQIVGQFTSDVRSYYPPEPYKGKGIRYKGEQVRRKDGKSVQ